MAIIPASVPVITVDGPGGAGKGTMARTLAARLGWHYLDSGILYRALALRARERDIDLQDADALCVLADALSVRCEPVGATIKMFVDGRPVDKEIYGERVGADASRLSALPAVRTALLACQRRFRRAPGLVADGRDMGSVVFPDAPLKFFLYADLDCRAARRLKQLREQGIDANLARLTRELAERDRRDRERAVAPLRAAADAVRIDNSARSVEDVSAMMMNEATRRFGRDNRSGSCV